MDENVLLMKLTSSTFSLHVIYHLSRRRGYVSRKGRDAEIKETKIISRIVLEAYFVVSW